MQSSKNGTNDLSFGMAACPPDTYWYQGQSMRGTFCLGDRLIVVPVAMDTVRPGDVLIYRQAVSRKNSPQHVVHRVMALTPNGVILRGDNNPENELVIANAIVGRVTHFNRNGKIRPVWGGQRGRIKGQLMSLRYALPRTAARFFWQKVAALPFLRLPYRWLRQSGLALRIWHPSVTKIYLETEDGPMIKYVVNHRTVARWWPQVNQFWCRKPYDLVIPKPDNELP